METSTLDSVDRLATEYLRAAYKPPRILIVEDEVLIRELMTAAFNGYDCTVDEVGDGLTAIKCISAVEYDFIFLDLNLPVCSGDSVLEVLKVNFPNVPVMIVTGYPDSEMMRQCQRLGFFSMVAKPFLLTPSVIERIFATRKISLKRRDSD